MTYEEIIEGLNDECEYFCTEAYENCADRCYIAQAIEILKKAEKYRWHDLRKNPEDLPEAEHAVVIAFLNGINLDKPCTARAFYEDGKTLVCTSGYNWFDIDNWDVDEDENSEVIPEGWWEDVWFCEEFRAVDSPVIAWREIEPFEGE